MKSIEIIRLPHSIDPLRRLIKPPIDTVFCSEFENRLREPLLCRGLEPLEHVCSATTVSPVETSILFIQQHRHPILGEGVAIFSGTFNPFKIRSPIPFDRIS